MKFRVLFLCADNGIQSKMAEAFLNWVDSNHFEAVSAGIEGGEVHSSTIEVMKEIGFELREATQGISDVWNTRFDFVITLCDCAEAGCPNFPQAEQVRWHLDDPCAELDEPQQKRLFRKLRDQIAQRVRLFSLVQARAAETMDQSAERLLPPDLDSVCNR